MHRSCEQGDTCCSRSKASGGAAPTQYLHLIFKLIIKRCKRIDNIQLTQNVYCLSFELLTEFIVVFLIYLPRLKIKIEIANGYIQCLFLE